ncbi:hypothetical protein LIER_40011 [Lithospermum erythrorhizon]|uniref:Reverse transcriptase n=1 Tax=Lithospermum erythrorhizon TaxID=34254 RepID=A0AAV3QPG5_LITER
MECFTALLMGRAEGGGFIFHPRCQEIDLVNVSFVNDLFIMCGASDASLRVVKDTLELFGHILGLRPNLSKSTCYFVGVEVVEEVRLGEILGMSFFSLPVRYLGIPPTTKQLRASDCRVLVDKVRLKIESWGNKQLSFAGRLVLINSVLFRVCNY